MHSGKKTLFFISLAVSLAVIWVIEAGVGQLLGKLTLSPPLSIISLGLFAAFFSWRQVLFATPFYAVLSYYLILGTAVFPGVRSSSILISGLLAAWVASQRSRILKHSEELDAILRTLPVPWILSDGSGNITRISEKARVLMASSSEDIIGASYFSFLSPSEGKGEFIRNYLSAFDDSVPPSRIKITFSKSPHTQAWATLFALECSEGRRLLTVFEAS